MRPKKGSYDAKFVKDFLMDDGSNGKNNTPTEVLMLPAGKTNIQKAENRGCPISPILWDPSHKSVLTLFLFFPLVMEHVQRLLQNFPKHPQFFNFCCYDNEGSYGTFK